MAIDWNKQAEGPEKLHEGYHRVTITKVLRTKKDGKELATKDGKPMMLVVVGDGSGAEASSSFTIDPAKPYFIARLIVACGKQDEFEDVEDFEDEDTAKGLEDVRMWVRVTHNGQYANFEPLPESDVPADVIQAAKAAHRAGKKPAPVPVTPAGEDVAEDDIPF